MMAQLTSEEIDFISGYLIKKIALYLLYWFMEILHFMKINKIFNYLLLELGLLLLKMTCILGRCLSNL